MLDHRRAGMGRFHRELAIAYGSGADRTAGLGGRASFQVVYTALRGRKPVVTIDMIVAAHAAVAACAATGTSLRVSGDDRWLLQVVPSCGTGAGPARQ